jgi:hypothetical protein
VLSILDANTFIVFSGGNTNLTIPLNANVGFEIGTKIEAFITGAVRLNVVATSGVSIVAPNGLIALNQSTLLLTKIAVNTWYVNIIPKLFLSPDVGVQYSAQLSLLDVTLVRSIALQCATIFGDGGGVAALRALFGGGVNNRWESTVRLRLAAGLTPSNEQDLTPKSYVDAIPNQTLNVLPKKGASGFVDSSIFDNGNVGIGTTTPTEKLEVVGNGKFSGAVSANTFFAGGSNSTVLIQNSGGGNYGLRVENTTDSFAAIAIKGGLNVSNGQLMLFGQRDNGEMFFFNQGLNPIVFSINGTERIKVSNEGNLGVNQTNPTEKLDVNGSIKLSNLLKLGQFTTATEPAYVKGASFFNTTLNKMRIGGATAYETVTSS